MKHSRQRDAILNHLQSRQDHPTAEAIYNSVRQEYPNISLGTVYRNLSMLVDIGSVIKVPCDDGSVHFDGRVSPHYHFQCLNCKKIIDLEISEETRMYEKKIVDMAEKEFAGEIEGKATFFYGKCSACLKAAPKGYQKR
ncbi:MAG: transcriptional repressor [Eubacteriales bacterium]|nr:transcriptional repressor [Eubacteriales bacterium]